MSGVPASLFISYARVNSCFVDRLEADLQVCNFSTWVDRRNIESNQPWKDILRNAIDRCDVLLLILSPAALLSSQVRMEYHYALQTGKPLIALEHQTCVELPPELHNVQRISFTTDAKQGLQNLLIALSQREMVVPAKVKRTCKARYRITYRTTLRAMRSRHTGPSATKRTLIRLYNSSMIAQHSRNVALRAALWQRILQRDVGFRQGNLAIQLERLRTALRSRHIRYFHEQACSAQDAEDWRKAAGFWQALLEQDDQNSEALQALEYCLRTQGNRSGASGEWEQAINLWEALLKLRPDDVQAKRQLALAQHNQEYIRYYQDAELLIEDDMLPLAKTMLTRLYADAPYYGDPLELAQKAGITAPIRSPITFEKEEAEREAEREAQARKNKEEVARLAQEAVRILVELAQKAARQRVLWEQELERRREQQVKNDEEQARQRAIEQAKRRGPARFIHRELETEPFVVWCSCFFLLSGSSSVIGIVTQSWYWALAALITTAIVAYALGHHRIVHRLPRRLLPRVKQETHSSYKKKSGEPASTTTYTIVALVIVGLCCLVTFGVMHFVVLRLRYNSQQVDHYLWMSRTSWLGGQIKTGAIEGAILSLILTIVFQVRAHTYGTAFLKALTYGSLITFFCWLISSACALLLNLGWGFSGEWPVSLIGLIFGTMSGIGLGSSFLIWTKGKPIF